jgi:HlyD family secretion protein
MYRRGKFVILMLALTLAVTGCGKKDAVTKADAESAAVPVQVEQVKLGSIDGQAGITGKFAPNQSIQMAPKVNGKISGVNVELGQFVNKGDVLFSLDPTDLQNTVKQSQAAYQVAQANMKQAQNNSQQGIEQAQSNVAQTRNSVDQAEQAYQDAQKNATRTQQLFDAGAVSSVDLEKAQTSLKNAEFALQNAQTSHENATGSATHAEQQSAVEVAQASLEQAKVNLENAQDQLANSVVKAPVSGMISNVNGSTGQMASPQSPVVTIVSIDPILVKANLSENEVTRIKIGAPVTVEALAVSKKIDAKVTAISPVMDPQLKAYPMEISIPNPNREWKADMVVNIIFKDMNPNQVKVVSQNAVFEEQGKKYVYRVENGVAKKVEVTTGQETSKEIEIKSGLSNSDTVVVKGQTLIKDGAKVEIQNQ